MASGDPVTSTSTAPQRHLPRCNILHPFNRFGIENMRRLPGVLSRWRGDALLSRSRWILDVPHFNDLAVGNPVDRNPRPFQLFSGRANAVERTLVGAVKGDPGYDLVAFGDLIPDGQMVV